MVALAGSRWRASVGQSSLCLSPTPRGGTFVARHLLACGSDTLQGGPAAELRHTRHKFWPLLSNLAGWRPHGVARPVVGAGGLRCVVWGRGRARRPPVAPSWSIGKHATRQGKWARVRRVGCWQPSSHGCSSLADRNRSSCCLRAASENAPRTGPLTGTSRFQAHFLLLDSTPAASLWREQPVSQRDICTIRA